MFDSVHKLVFYTDVSLYENLLVDNNIISFVSILSSLPFLLTINLIVNMRISLVDNELHKKIISAL